MDARTHVHPQSLNHNPMGCDLLAQFSRCYSEGLVVRPAGEKKWCCWVRIVPPPPAVSLLGTGEKFFYSLHAQMYG